MPFSVIQYNGQKINVSGKFVVYLANFAKNKKGCPQNLRQPRKPTDSLLEICCCLVFPVDDFFRLKEDVDFAFCTFIAV